MGSDTVFKEHKFRYELK